jgi:hypothetical protein
MFSIIQILEPVFLATKEIESRKCPISSYVPIVKTVMDCMNDELTGDVLALNAFKAEFEKKMKRRMAECEWEEWCHINADGKIIDSPGFRRNKYLFSNSKIKTD